MADNKPQETLLDQINHHTFISWLLNYSRVPNSQMDFLGYALHNSNNRDEFMRTVVMNMTDQENISAISDALDEARIDKLSVTKK